MATPDWLILGGGIAGLATAWHLGRARAGRVLLLERERTLGSQASAQNAAVLRTFGADPVLAGIARRAAAFLRAPGEGFARAPLVDERGLLLFASGDTAERLRRAHARIPRPDAGSVLSRDAWRRLAPRLRSDADLCLHFPRDGELDVAGELEGFARGARAAGVEIRTGAAARRLIVASGRVVGVELAGGERVRAGTTVLAAGGWAGRLGSEAGSAVELRPTRRHLMTTAHDPEIDRRTPVVWIEDAGFYCRPESGGMLLSACDVTDVDPDRCANAPWAREAIATKAQRFLPSLAEAGAAHLWCGIRTLTRDDRFAIGPDPDLSGLFWVAGLGGHGMTCGPEVGRLASARLLSRYAEPEVAAALDPARLVPPSGAVPGVPALASAPARGA